MAVGPRPVSGANNSNEGAELCLSPWSMQSPLGPSWLCLGQGQVSMPVRWALVPCQSAGCSASTSFSAHSSGNQGLAPLPRAPCPSSSFSSSPSSTLYCPFTPSPLLPFLLPFFSFHGSCVPRPTPCFPGPEAVYPVTFLSHSLFYV